jgi:small nuclear ribonucleoprotein (snRNP)-like protein
MLEELIGKRVVVDLRSPYVCMGTLEGYDELHLKLKDADVHDLRDSDTSRENYTAAARVTGIKRNRKHVLIVRGDIVAISRFEDVVDE